MNQKIHDIALQVGGSFYPDVGGDLLEKAILMAVRECMDIATENGCDYTAMDIATRFGIDQWA